MSRLVIVENDNVRGVDKHNVSGFTSSPPPPVDYTGVGDFDYVGKMTDQLSDFVRIDGIPVATEESRSALNPGEDTPIGKHIGPNGSNFTPPGSDTTTLTITDPIGEGTPSASAGSAFVRINGVAVLLDGDKIDTCDGLGIPENATVTAKNQDFVSCAE
jgi:uncharacterized Zn-binding protein involved in type VI secretion